MNRVRFLACIFAIGMSAAPLLATANDEEAFGQFQEILRALHEQSFETIQAAIDETDMRNRVFSARPIDPEVRQSLNLEFWQALENVIFMELPPPGSGGRMELVDFAFQGGQGKAAVRLSKPGFAFAYLIFDLRHDSRGRMKIIDWFDSSFGQMFSAQVAELLMITMPSKAATRQMLSVQGLTDAELFQVTEAYKAMRDRQAARFFDIYDGFDVALRREPFIARFATLLAYELKDADRLASTLATFTDVYAEQPNFSLIAGEFYLAIGAYEKSYDLLAQFQETLPVNEGALPAKLSALALAIGRPDDALRYAQEATKDEPALELGWWSLLRARSSTGDYAGAIEPLTQLEDNFGQRLDEAKLRRDKFRGFVGLVQSEEFKEWRASRP